MARKRSNVWEGAATAVENARRVLPRRALRFFRAGRKLVDENTSYEQLHVFRLDAKRFRYSLEVFRPLYGQGLERRLDSLRQVQQYLGEINDCVTTRALLEKTGAVRPGNVTQVFAFLESEAERVAGEFRVFWKEKFDQPGQERQWAGYLRRYAGRTTGRGE